MKSTQKTQTNNIEEKDLENENSITHGIIWQQLLLYFFPLLFGTFFQQLYNTVDAVIVGRFVSKQALAAVGGSSAIIVNLFVGFFVGVSSGATVIISQYFGANDKRSVEKGVHTAVAMALAGGVIFMLLGLAFSSFFISIMNTPADTVTDSVIYLRIYFCGMIPNLVYNVGAGILRAVGDSKRPLYVLIVSCIANIILDIVFVLTFHMGVAGVAIATILCQCLSAVMVIMILMRSKDSFRLELKNIRIDREILGKIIYIGLPSGLQSLMYTVSNLLIQTSINGFDTNTVSAWAAYGKIDCVFWMIIGSLGISVTTFAGQNFGAGFYRRVRSGLRQCFIIAILFTIVLSGLLLHFGSSIFALFTTDADVIRVGTEMLTYFVPCYITYIGIEMFSGVLRGMGDSIWPMIITLTGVCVLRVVWIIVMVPIRHSLTTVMFSYPLTWVVTSVMFLISYELYVRKHHIG